MKGIADKERTATNDTSMSKISTLATLRNLLKSRNMPTFRTSKRDKHKTKIIFCTSYCNVQMYIVKCMICEFSTQKHGHKNISPGMGSYMHVYLVLLENEQYYSM